MLDMLMQELDGTAITRDSVLDAIVRMASAVRAASSVLPSTPSPTIRFERDLADGRREITVIDRLTKEIVGVEYEATVSPPDTGTVPTDGPGDTSVGRLDGGETSPET